MALPPNIAGYTLNAYSVSVYLLFNRGLESLKEDRNVNMGNLHLTRPENIDKLELGLGNRFEGLCKNWGVSFAIEKVGGK
jgi:hypothetical protein